MKIEALSFLPLRHSPVDKRSFSGKITNPFRFPDNLSHSGRRKLTNALLQRFPPMLRRN